MLSFGFNHTGASTEELLEMLREILTALFKIGANVAFIVCDQGTNNQKLFKILKITRDNPFFMHENRKVYASFDWPHLIKRLLVQLRSHNFIYCNDKIIMNFSDLLETWQLDRTSNTSRLLSHLSAEHFKPNNFDVIKVKFAFQLVNRRTAAAIETAGRTGALKSNTWQISASFIK